MNDPSEILRHIKKVDAPFFLETRIAQKIKNQPNEQVDKFWYQTTFATLAILLCINIYAICSINVTNNDKVSVFDDMNLIDNSNLYFYD